MIGRVVGRSRAQLTRHENELEYLKESLATLRELSATEHDWLEFAEAWIAVIKLRSEMEAERGQAVIDCILMDERVVQGLGIAQQLLSITGKPPARLLQQLKAGPGSHLKTHAYQCVRIHRSGCSAHV